MRIEKNIFLIDEVISKSNFLRINLEKMYEDALNPIIAKNSIKRELEDNRKDYKPKKRLLQSKDHWKRRRDDRIKERIKIENSNKCYIKNNLVLYFSLIIFLVKNDHDGFEE